MWEVGSCFIRHVVDALASRFTRAIEVEWTRIGFSALVSRKTNKRSSYMDIFVKKMQKKKMSVCLNKDYII